MTKEFFNSEFLVKKTGNTSGQMIIEVLVAFFLLSVGLGGILGFMYSSFRDLTVVPDQYLAAGLAMEGVEIIKNIIDANIIQGCPWNEGFRNGSFEVDIRTLGPDPSVLGCGTWSMDSYPYQGRFILFDPQFALYSYLPGGTPTTFRRRIDIALIGSDEIRVNSVVDWTSLRGQYSNSVNVEDHFFNWRP